MPERNWIVVRSRHGLPGYELVYANLTAREANDVLTRLEADPDPDPEMIYDALID